MHLLFLDGEERWNGVPHEIILRAEIKSAKRTRNEYFPDLYESDINCVYLLDGPIRICGAGKYQ